MSRAANIYWLPRALSFHNDPREHRLYALINDLPPSAHAAGVYGSTSDAESRNGTVSLLVQPRRRGVHPNGLRDPTHFYPAVLRPTHSEDIPAPIGRLNEAEHTALKKLIPMALGFNSGNCFASGAAHGSMRGIVVEVDEATSELTGTPFAVVFTSHPYSAKKRGYLALIPLIFDSEPEEGQDVLIEHEVKFSELQEGVDSGLLLVTNIYSVRKESQIRRRTHVTIPTPQLRKAEQVLKAWMGL